MDIKEIDHVEFHVGDAQHAAFYLCTALGFRLVGRGGPDTGMVDQRSLLVRQGGIHLLLTSALVPDHPAARYVAQHGDGVAVIAIGTSDARDAFDAAVRAGAVPVQPPTECSDGAEIVTVAEVAGFGDVRHRFVQRAEGSREFLPGVVESLPHADNGKADEDLLSAIDHVAVCLPSGDLSSTVDFYERVFDFRMIFEENIEVGDQAMNSKVVQSLSGGVTFTLIEPDAARQPGQLDRFIARHGGPGVQHLAFLCDDIVGAVTTLTDRGVQFLDTAENYYRALADRIGDTTVDIGDLRRTNVLVDRDHWGEVFQIFTRSMHVRDTYFTEIIDRRGAKTFGSGNIKALYAAVQESEPADDLAVI